MLRIKSVVLLILGGLMLSGCTLKELFAYQPPEQQEEIFTLSEEHQPQLRLIAQWLHYSARMANAKSEVRRKELVRLQNSSDRSEQGKLMMLLALGTPTQLEQAKKLGAEQLRNAQINQEQILANFLQMVVTQIKSQQEAIVAEARLQQQEEQAELLTKQINALKHIEKNIYEREYGITDSGE